MQINRDRLTAPDDPNLRVPQEEFRDPVRALRERIRDDLDDVTGILFFGSVARGEADRQSEIDCVVRVSDNRANTQRRAHELGERRFDGDRYAFQILVESAEFAD